MTFVWLWQPMVVTFWWPWRPMVKPLWWPWWLVVKTLWQPLLRLVATMWLPWMTLVTTLMTSINQNFGIGHSLSPWLRTRDKKDNEVMPRMTNGPKRWHDKSCVMADVTTAYNTWQPKWQPKYNSDDPDNNEWLPWMINVMTCWQPSEISWQHLTTPSGDIYCQSSKLPVLHIFWIAFQFDMLEGSFAGYSKLK